MTTGLRDKNNRLIWPGDIIELDGERFTIDYDASLGRFMEWTVMSSRELRPTLYKHATIVPTRR